MAPVLLKMLPFALGAIAPTMIGLVVIFLTGTRGNPIVRVHPWQVPLLCILGTDMP